MLTGRKAFLRDTTTPTLAAILRDEWVNPREKASVRPSGETAALLSPFEPAGGEVNFRFSPLSTATRTIALPSRTARNLPSGVHAGAVNITIPWRSVSFFLTPPRGEINRSSNDVVPEARWRRASGKESGTQRHPSWPEPSPHTASKPKPRQDSNVKTKSLAVWPRVNLMLSTSDGVAPHTGLESITRS